MPKFWKSKTINFNIIYAALVTIITQGFGINISPELIAAIGTLLNIILRAITKEPLSAK